MFWQAMSLGRQAYAWARNLIPRQAKNADEFVTLLRDGGCTSVTAHISEQFYSYNPENMHAGGFTHYAAIYKSRAKDGSRIRFKERYGRVYSEPGQVLALEEHMRRVKYTVRIRLQQFVAQLPGLTWTIRTTLEGELDQQAIERISQDAERLALDLLSPE